MLKQVAPMQEMLTQMETTLEATPATSMGAQPQQVLPHRAPKFDDVHLWALYNELHSMSLNLSDRTAIQFRIIPAISSDKGESHGLLQIDRPSM